VHDFGEHDEREGLSLGGGDADRQSR
jgi:hypothetical protein